jgi:hypothetical protein
MWRQGKGKGNGELIAFIYSDKSGRSVTNQTRISFGYHTRTLVRSKTNAGTFLA